MSLAVAIASSSSEKVISSWPSRPSALLPAECSSGFSAAAVAACAAWLPRGPFALELRDLMHDMQGERVHFHRRAPARPRWLVRSEWIWL